MGCGNVLAQRKPGIVGCIGSGRGHHHVSVEAFGFCHPNRFHPQQAPIQPAHVVLAIIEGGPPTSAFELATLFRL